MTDFTPPHPEPLQPEASGAARQVRVVENRSTSQKLAKVSRGVWMVTMATQFLLLFRFLLRLLEANPGNPFARLIFSLSDAVLIPFRNLVRNPELGGIVLDAEAIIAALAYLVLAWLVVEALWVLFYGQRRKVVIEEKRNT